jgi:hypothetical protein
MLIEKLQKKIDDYRKDGVIIEVSHSLADPKAAFEDFDETTISIKFSDDYDAFDVGYNLQTITGRCDSGAGFGYRDLQLGLLWEGLK